MTRHYFIGLSKIEIADSAQPGKKLLSSHRTLFPVREWVWARD